MARSLVTRFYNSPHLHVAEDGEFFLFVTGTSKDEIIDTLENYFEFRGWTRAYRYEVIGEVLTNDFKQTWDDAAKIQIDACTHPIEVHL